MSTRSIDTQQWRALKHGLNASFRSSMHYAIASVGPSGEPFVTPIGSLLLAEPGHAFYFEIFATGLGERLAHNPHVSVLAVDSSKLLWLAALARGEFVRRPSFRLRGRASPESRAATDIEQNRWRRRVRPVAWLTGGRRLWGDLSRVRDLWIDSVESIHLGPLTASAEPEMCGR